MPDDLSRPRVGIVMGSDSDWPVMSAAGLALREFDVPSKQMSSQRTECPMP
jgi:5-(carboxyamino)imidazole ribonucleotide mutase